MQLEWKNWRTLEIPLGLGVLATEIVPGVTRKLKWVIEHHRTLYSPTVSLEEGGVVTHCGNQALSYTMAEEILSNYYVQSIQIFFHKNRQTKENSLRFREI